MDGQGPPAEGIEYHLLCNVDNARPQPETNGFTWWRNGEPPLPEETNILTLQLHRSMHGQKYTCAATNTAGTGSKSTEYTLAVYCKSIYQLI